MPKLDLLPVAALLLLGTQTAHALTPWANGTPNLTVRVSGAVAVTNAYAQVVTDSLAASGTLDTFNDVDPTTGSKGSNWTAHYFIGHANLGSGLAGKKILLLRRTRGGTGYGVIPLNSNIPLEHLNIAGLTQADWVTDGAYAWKQTISAANAKKYLSKNISDGGVIALDPFSVLKPGTAVYPDQQNELITGLPESGWPTTLAALPTTGSAAFTIQPTGGLAYGVAVTLDLYKALQAAQKRAGILPSTTAIGSYTEASMPTLSSQVLASILSGKIGAWDELQIVDKTDGNLAKSLVHADILTDANIPAPAKESTTGNNLTPIALGLRNQGAATGVLAYSVFLKYPGVKNTFAPASKTADNALDEDASLPIVKQPIIIADTGTLLKDWQNGTNTLGFNNVAAGTGFAKRWGIAINTADRNTNVTAAGSGGDPWRYIRIDGYAPTLENVAAGTYAYWAEGSVLYRTSKTDPQWALKTKILKTLADGLGSPSIIGPSVTTQAWGKTGAFATTADPRGFTTSIPFNPSQPVVPFTHKNAGVVRVDLPPVAYPNASGVKVQLK